MAQANQNQATNTNAQPKPETPKFDAAAYIKAKGSKSAAIRQLTADGKTRGEVAKLLGIKYQHVRNVLITPVKNPKPVPAPEQSAQTKTA